MFTSMSDIKALRRFRHMEADELRELFNGR